MHWKSLDPAQVRTSFLKMEDKHRQAIMQNLDELVDRTTDEAFEQMKNFFVYKRALNDYMVNKIMNANSSKERKRLFYKIVTKRGPTAFSLLIEALKDSNLHSLGLLLENNRLLRPMECESPFDEADGNCISYRQSDEQINNSREIYMHSPGNIKGYVLIINIMDFMGFPFETRNGSDKDVKRLEKVWKGRGFKVITKTNVKQKDFIDLIKNFTSMEELKSADSAILIVMTHGEAEHPRQLKLRMHDWLSVDSEWIIQQFNSINCKYLAGKPKIIVFQSCRGTDKDRGVAIEFDGGNWLTKKIKLMPTLTAVLAVYATLPGSVAFRHPQNGSFFIQLLCDILETTSDPLDIEDVIKEVSRRLTEKCENEEEKYLQGVHWENLRFDKSFYV